MNTTTEKKTMTYLEVIDVIKSLAQSQGYYGRLLRSIKRLYEDDYDTFLEWADDIEKEGFTDSLDVIMYFECGMF